MSHQYPSYPPPEPSSLQNPQRLAATARINPRPLPPLHKPPPSSTSPLPPLPSPVRNPSFTTSYTLTTHLYPSAYPRASVSARPLPRSSYVDIPGETKSERLARQDALVRELWMWSRRVGGDGGNGSEGRGEAGCDVGEDGVVPCNVVNRYVRNDLLAGGKRETKGVTLCLAHANGFPKEIWEPCLEEIFLRAEAAHILIDEVWALEAIQHGDSAIINDSVLGDTFDWIDNTRDILTFLIHHLPQSTSFFPALPTHLPRLPDAITAQRCSEGYADRTLVGMGHSLGGCSIARAAITYPALFSSLILVDPIIRLPSVHPALETAPPVMATLAIRRQTMWKSRKDALSTLQRSPFFGAWHPDVLKKYVQYGMCPAALHFSHTSTTTTEDGVAVRLKMSGMQEAVVFIDRRVSYETWKLLPQLDARVALYFILSGKDATNLGGEQAARELVWRREVNSSNVLVPSAGHLIPQETPQELAVLVVEFLKNRYSRDDEVRQKAML